MTDTNSVRETVLGDESLDEFADIENDMVWTREHTRSLGLLFGGFAVIVAIIALGLFFG